MEFYYFFFIEAQKKFLLGFVSGNTNEAPLIAKWQGIEAVLINLAQKEVTSMSPNEKQEKVQQVLEETSTAYKISCETAHVNTDYADYASASSLSSFQQALKDPDGLRRKLPHSAVALSSGAGAATLPRPPPYTERPSSRT